MDRLIDHGLIDYLNNRSVLMLSLILLHRNQIWVKISPETQISISLARKSPSPSTLLLPLQTPLHSRPLTPTARTRTLPQPWISTRSRSPMRILIMMTRKMRRRRYLHPPMGYGPCYVKAASSMCYPKRRSL